MKINKKYMRFISIVLIASFINYCVSYNRVTLSKEKIEIKNKIILLHYNNAMHYLVNGKLDNNKLIGDVRSSKGRTIIQPHQEIHIYLDAVTLPILTVDERIIIPFDAIQKIEANEIDVGTTIVYTIGTLAAVAAILFLILLLTKDSCPFIYAYNGSTYDFSGEIYSGAIFPQLERHDYLTLPTLMADSSEYKIKMANKVHEIQYTNLAELLVIDHPENSKVLVDKKGVPYTFTNPHSPFKAVNFNDKSIHSMVEKKDSLFYIADTISEKDVLMDGMVLSFDRPEKSKKAKLLIRAKNSFWLDHINGEFYSLFGDAYGDWYEEQKEAPKEEMQKWAMDQGIPLSVYLEKNGRWEYEDNFNIVGPLALKDDIMAIDISEIEGDEIKVKLEYGFLFWEIDYVAMDFSAELPVIEQTVSLKSATDKDNQDVLKLLQKDDDQYQTMSHIGDQVLFKFREPAVVEDMKRTTILHSKGHYEILRDFSGSPDIGYLMSFKKPGKFIEFSKERYMQLLKSFEN